MCRPKAVSLYPGGVNGQCLIVRSPGKIKPGLIAFANFHGVNAPTMANFEPFNMRYHCMWT